MRKPVLQCDNTDGFHITEEWKKPDVKGYILYESICIKFNNQHKLAMIIKVIIMVTFGEY